MTDSAHQVVPIARAFAADYVDANAPQWEAERRLPREGIVAAAQRGLCGLIVPEAMGGCGLDVAGMARVMEALAYADMGFAFSLVCHNNLAGAIAKRGSPYHRERYLGPMMAGHMVGGFLLTEPGAGSDAAAITATARARGDGWVLEGEKSWATNGTEADVLVVYVQTEPGRGARGIAAFLVDTDQAGVERGEPYQMLGAHASGTSSFRFDGVELRPEQCFAPPGEAFRAALEAIDIARIVVSAMCAGMMQRGLDVAVDYVKQREAFGGPLAEKQGLQWILADVATDLEAARALRAAASAALDRGDSDVGVRAAHAKKFATRAALAGLSQCMQALGANGFRHDQPLARHLAGAKMSQYIDGTTEIQNVVISRALFG